MPDIIFRISYHWHHSAINRSIRPEKIIKVEWYLETPRSVKKTRDVSHYTRDFVENIFKRHHFAAVLSVFAAFLFLIGIGFLQDSAFFQIPAAASITVFFCNTYWCCGRLHLFPAKLERTLSARLDHRS